MSASNRSEDIRGTGSTPWATSLSRVRRLSSAPEFGILIPLVLLALIFQFNNNLFLSSANIFDILRNASFLFIVAAGTTLVFAAGGLDLSVGSVSALSAVVAGTVMVETGLPVALGILLAVCVGAFVGLVNGVVIVVGNIPPLIMTLGMLYAARGVINVVTRGAPVYPLPGELTAIAQGRAFGGTPWPVLIALGVGILAHITLTRTIFGREVLSVGGNPETSRLAGIRVREVQIAVYVIGGATAALAGILLAGRLNSAQPGQGQGLELLVIAAVIIGGTSLFGGSATVIGAGIGAILITMLSNGLTLVRVSPFWQNVVVGVVIVLAVAVDQWKRRRPSRVSL